ncbi:hypothetical protein [Micromonospora endolithica]|nr:hypothetical protein [Micromonospora endolithica]TWJ24509.1 von Hippel-Lindau disease tumor suppressor protein [Micromonospora endolithica]
MTDAPDFDDRPAETPGLRVGGWVPQPRDDTGPHATPATPQSRHRADTAAPTAPPRPPAPSTERPRGAYALAAAAVAVIALAVAVLAYPIVRSSPPVAAPPAAEPVAPVAGQTTADPTPEPERSFSPAPVSLSTRASKPPPAPTRKAKPTVRPTSARPTAPKSPPLPPGELAPLPASREPTLRSRGGGPETFVDFVNARRAPVHVHWLNYDGRRQRYAVLEPGQGYRQHTYVGHPWVVTEADGRALVCFQPATSVLKAVVR